MPFYEYNQNNSGGVFDVDFGIGRNVFIEAESAAQANEIGLAIGLYFDGTGDCSCCGNRWYEAYEPGEDEPLLYGRTRLRPLAHGEEAKMRMGDRDTSFVHYADGRVVEMVEVED